VTAPTLHQWLTRQVERAEIAARTALDVHPGPWAPDYAGELLDANGHRITDSEAAAIYLAAVQPDAILRRCKADRAILARHNTDPDQADSHAYATACASCGTYGDCDDPVTDNINDCPELLGLARAHGATDELLASLTRPEPPPPRPLSPNGVFGAAAHILNPLLHPGTAMTDVPPALRGPHWGTRTPTEQGQPPRPI
jgi:hypothetical protein